MELHCSMAVVKVGEKQNTAAAGAAYIARGKTVGHDGRVHDFRYRKNFVAGGLLLPDGAPERWRQDPSSIWAEQDYLDYVKSTRRGPKSELYRTGNMGLPWELGYERCIKIAEEFCERMRSEGMVVQWALHDEPEDKKKGSSRNLHIHWMAAMREVTPDGFGKKNRAWNNYNGGLNLPEILRPLAAELINRELEEVGLEFRVEHESFAKRKINKIPERHEGPMNHARKKSGKMSVLAEGNLKIREINKQNISYQEKLELYEKVRAEQTAKVDRELAQRHFTLEEQISQAVERGDIEDKAPAPPPSRVSFEDLKMCDFQEKNLQGELRKTKKLRQALYLYKNLSEDENLTSEQQKNLDWAIKYIKWSGMEEINLKIVEDKIKEVKERNLSHHHSLATVKKRRDVVLINYTLAKELERQDYVEKLRRGEGRALRRPVLDSKQR